MARGWKRGREPPRRIASSRGRRKDSVGARFAPSSTSRPGVVSSPSNWSLAHTSQSKVRDRPGRKARWEASNLPRRSVGSSMVGLTLAWWWRVPNATLAKRTSISAAWGPQSMGTSPAAHVASKAQTTRMGSPSASRASVSSSQLSRHHSATGQGISSAWASVT